MLLLLDPYPGITIFSNCSYRSPWVETLISAIPRRPFATWVPRRLYSPGPPLNLAVPDPSIASLRWTDDPEMGLAHRTITGAQDLLGAEGVVGQRELRFEKILQETKKQVVYSLYYEDSQFRIACAFSRELFTGANAPAPDESAVPLSLRHRFPGASG
jgi:hypothetical protein